MTGHLLGHDNYQDTVTINWNIQQNQLEIIFFYSNLAAAKWVCKNPYRARLEDQLDYLREVNFVPVELGSVISLFFF